MSKNLRLGAAALHFHSLCISKAPHPSSVRKRRTVLLEIFLTWSVKIPCLAVTPGNLRKAHCRKKLPLSHKQSRTELRRYPSDVRRRSSRSDISHLFRLRWTWNSLLRSLRCLLYHRGSAVSRLPCSDRRIRHTGLMCHLQPFRKCGKRISFSSGIREPAAVFCHLDSNRKRGLYPKYISSRRKSTSALRQRLCCYHRPYCRPCDGLRSQRFHEHGRLYGSCSL